MAWALILAGCAPAMTSFAVSAQPVVREIPRPKQPYVPLYSACRAKPPNDEVARLVFQTQPQRSNVAVFERQLGALRGIPVDSLSATEAEAYFVLLRQIASEAMVERGQLHRIRTIVLEGREHGAKIAARWNGDAFVRCAFLDSEAVVMREAGLNERFSVAERRKARDEYRSFLESVLRGEVRVEMYVDQIQSRVGQFYFDQAFEALPDVDAAGPLLETGAKYAFDAAANATDDRYPGEWRRYAFLLDKLPAARQLEISQRLLTHTERTWAGKSARSAGALEVYSYVLQSAGRLALDAKRGKDAVSIFTRQLEVAQELRRRDPADPNYQVEEALSYLVVGDAHVLAGDPKAAADAYDRAQRAHESANGSAKDMLKLQQFTEELASRRNRMR